MDKQREQFEAWAKTQGLSVDRHPTDGNYWYISTLNAWSLWQAALAARQPVGQEPVATLYVAERDGRKANVLANVTDLPEGKYSLYSAPPAQAVDLGQFVPAEKPVPAQYTEDDSDAQYNSGWNDCRDAMRALIDSQGVKK